MLATPFSFSLPSPCTRSIFLDPLFPLPSSFFSTCWTCCLASPKSAMTDSFEGMTFAGWIPGTYTAIPADPDRGKIRSPCKTISTIETFVTGYGSLILGTRLISERRETMDGINFCSTERRSRVDLVQRRNVYIYIFFLLFHLDTFSRELKLYHKNQKLQEIN